MNIDKMDRLIRDMEKAVAESRERPCDTATSRLRGFCDLVALGYWEETGRLADNAAGEKPEASPTCSNCIDLRKSNRDLAVRESKALADAAKSAQACSRIGGELYGLRITLRTLAKELAKTRVER